MHASRRVSPSSLISATGLSNMSMLITYRLVAQIGSQIFRQSGKSRLAPKSNSGQERIFTSFSCAATRYLLCPPAPCSAKLFFWIIPRIEQAVKRLVKGFGGVKSVNEVPSHGLQSDSGGQLLGTPPFQVDYVVDASIEHLALPQPSTVGLLFRTLRKPSQVQRCHHRCDDSGDRDRGRAGLEPHVFRQSNDSLRRAR